MFTISKDFAFSASHRLDHLPEDHQCHRLHGHNYVVRVELAANKLDTDGMILDYGLLAPFRDYIDDELDHRHLNDVVMGPTTAERLARHLHDHLDYLLVELASRRGIGIAVAVSETPKTWATFHSPTWLALMAQRWVPSS